MRRFDEVSKQVMTLSPDDRLFLVDWIMERTGAPIGVAEAAPDYALMTDRSRKVTLQEFLEFERSTPLAHELVAGEIYAMSEPSASHDLVVTNLIADVRSHLRGQPCRTHTSSKKVQFKCRDDDIVYRPDLWVACGETGMPKVSSSRSRASSSKYYRARRSASTAAKKRSTTGRFPRSRRSCWSPGKPPASPSSAAPSNGAPLCSDPCRTLSS